MRSAGRAWRLARLAAALALLAAWGGAPGWPAATPARPGTRGVTRGLILCIGDGMGWGAVSIALAKDPAATLLSGADSVGAVQTSSFDAVVTDSAAAATAMATGRRARNQHLALDPETRTPMRTIAEIARDRGLAVGLVTTSTIVHATPAAFAAHVDDRYKYDEIAVQVSETRFDLLAGGGSGYFRPGSAGGLRKDERDLLAGMRASGTTIVSSLSEALTVPGKQRLALLYSPDDPEPAGDKRPPLADLVTLAFERLAADPDGFFLMVEGAQIDWCEHDQDGPCLPPELADFDRAVLRARTLAAGRPETRVVVVADHDTGSPALVQEGDKPTSPVELRFLIGDHTAQLVPLLVNGDPSRLWARSTHLTDLGQAMSRWLVGEPPGR